MLKIFSGQKFFQTKFFFLIYTLFWKNVFQIEFLDLKFFSDQNYFSGQEYFLEAKIFFDQKSFFDQESFVNQKSFVDQKSFLDQNCLTIFGEQKKFSRKNFSLTKFFSRKIF